MADFMGSEWGLLLHGHFQSELVIVVMTILVITSAGIYWGVRHWALCELSHCILLEILSQSGIIPISQREKIRLKAVKTPPKATQPASRVALAQHTSGLQTPADTVCYCTGRCPMGNE